MSVTLVCQREGRISGERADKVVRRFDRRETPATGGLRKLNSECVFNLIFTEYYWNETIKDGEMGGAFRRP